MHVASRYQIRTLATTAYVESAAGVIALPRLTLLLLAYLTLEQRGVARSELCKLFWPALQPDRARHALSQQLYVMRQRLPHLPITTIDDVIAVDTRHIECDAASLLVAGTTHEHALRYHSGFLEGYIQHMPKELQYWAESVDRSIRRRVADALSLGVADAQRAHDWTVVEQTCKRLMSLGKRDPTTYAALAAALTGQQRFEEAGHVIGEGKTIFGNDWAFVPQDIPAAPDNETRYVGRTAEFNRLRKHWDSAVRGNTKLVFITGVAGIGKTRLAYQLMKLAALQGATILSSRCFGGSGRLAYAPVVSLAARLLDLTRCDLPSWVIRGLESIERIAPESGGVQGANQEVGRPDVVYAFSRAVLHSAAQRPVIVVIDDCQWLDPPSAELLHYLASGHPEAKLMVVCCARTAAPTGGTGLALQGAADDTVVLHELTQAEAVALAGEYCRSSELEESALESLISRSGRNPFFLLELLRGRHAADVIGGGERPELPVSIQRLIAQRLQDLSAAARRVARAAAVLDDHAAPATVCRVAAVGERQLMQCVDELTGEGFLYPNGSPLLRLRHDLLREGTYALTPPAVRLLMHRRAAIALRAISASPAAVAQHADLAGMTKLAWASALASGDRAARVAASSHALGWYRRAHAMPVPRPARARVEDRIIRLVVSGGIPTHEAMPYVSGLEEWYSSRGDAGGLLRCEYVRIHAGLATGTSSQRERYQQYSDLSARAQAHGDTLLAVEAASQALASAQHAERRIDMAALIRASLSDLSLYSSQDRIGIRAFGAVALVACGTYQEAVAVAEAAVAEAQQLMDVPALIVSRSARGAAYTAACRLEEARRELEWAISECESSGYVGPLVRTRLNYGVLLLDLGRCEEALALFESHIVGPERWRNVFALINGALAAFESEQYERAVALLEMCFQEAERLRLTWLSSAATAISGLIALRRADATTAESHWLRLRETLENDLSATSDPVPAATFAARMLFSEGRVDDALQLLHATAQDCMCRQPLMAARLRLEAAQLQVDSAPDSSYRLAADAVQFAQGCGAASIEKSARRLIQELELKAR